MLYVKTGPRQKLFSLCNNWAMSLRVTRSLLRKEHIELPSGLYVERRATVTVDDHPESGFELKMKVEFDETVQRLVARDVSVRATEKGLEVSGTILRAVRVQELLQQAGLLLVSKRSEGISGAEIGVSEIFKSYRENADEHKKSPKAASEIYVVATVLNYPPLKTISDILGVSQSTATRLVAVARALGLLGDPHG